MYSQTLDTGIPSSRLLSGKPLHSIPSLGVDLHEPERLMEAVLVCIEEHVFGIEAEGAVERLVKEKEMRFGR